MANTAVSGTLFCSDGTEIPLYLAAVAEGTETSLTTSTQSNFTVSASAVGTAFAGKTVVAPGTKTCVGIGPEEEEKLDSITGELNLL